MHHHLESDDMFFCLLDCVMEVMEEVKVEGGEVREVREKIVAVGGV